MLKNLLLFQTLFCCWFNLAAQEKNNINLGIEIGLLDLSESESFGLFLNVEPKLKSSRSTTIGLRLGATFNSQTIENNDSTQFSFDHESDNGVISILPTFDYYWNGNKFRPSLGLGIGSHILAGSIDVSRFSTASHTEEVFEVNVRYQIGFLLRGGFELGRSRIGLEYNFVPKADIELPDGQKTGTVDSNYLGLSIGFGIVGR